MMNNQEQLRIVAVKKDGRSITDYKLSDGNIVSKLEGVQMCINGKLPTYHVGTSKAGTQFLADDKENGTGDKYDMNIADLPTFE